MPFLVVVQLASTLYMVGLIWFVQLVHYPLFSAVGIKEFPAYEQSHQRLTTWAVGPMMLIELVSTFALPFRMPVGSATWLAWLGLALLIAIWLSTWLLQVPAHHSLQVNGFSHTVHSRLVRTNWIRTVAWSVRGLIALAITMSCIQS